MTTNYTNQEWQRIVVDVEKNIKVDESKSYHVPNVASTVDHTLLKLDSTSSQFDDLCNEARKDEFASVCVRPKWVEQCVNNLKGSGVKVASVVGFHEGTYTLEQKLKDTKTSLEAGAAELDLVINWPQLQQQEYEAIYAELAAIRSAAPHPTLIKLILETSQLNDQQIIAGSVLASAAGLDFIKTATGFHGHGATLPHVRLMKAACEYLAKNPVQSGSAANQMLVKASGGIRSLDDAVKMLEVGASRLGTSGGVLIAKQASEKETGTNSSSGQAKLDSDY
ncbi:Putative deoC/FbaB/LacD aldolase, aldolase-type TIM barrel [Septoria linicola]|uniref:deoxyribose-phosphate aldolase n=1 Tax=Septoria linicola TaxID=215465 RepID=A0A9Q9AQP5_9PEZI|nr:putative deoC/FbaB/LacD aldolase, aldolase-type TIM barrel, deoxyribose-phosphate aldolase type I [Septoria linicola]USW50815.1 Putative deoC/FbaB/LacD aldolase, aldolase-type TIM barrel [Septoria linicola]